MITPITPITATINLHNNLKQREEAKKKGGKKREDKKQRDRKEMDYTEISREAQVKQTLED